MLYFFLAIVFVCIAILFLCRGNSSPYKGTVGEKFRPLTHIEIEAGKQFIYHLNDKWTYECKLNSLKNLYTLWNAKDMIIEAFNNNKLSLDISCMLLKELMYQMGEKPRGWIKRMQYRISFFKIFNDKIPNFIELFNDMLDYQTRLFFLLRCIREKILVQQEPFTKMDGDALYQEQMRGPRYGSNIFLNANTKKNKKNSKTKSVKNTGQNTVASPWVKMLHGGGG